MSWGELGRRRPLHWPANRSGRRLLVGGLTWCAGFRTIARPATRGTVGRAVAALLARLGVHSQVLHQELIQLPRQAVKDEIVAAEADSAA